MDSGLPRPRIGLVEQVPSRSRSGSEPSRLRPEPGGDRAGYHDDGHLPVRILPQPVPADQVLDLRGVDVHDEPVRSTSQAVACGLDCDIAPSRAAWIIRESGQDPGMSPPPTCSTAGAQHDPPGIKIHTGVRQRSEETSSPVSQPAIDDPADRLTCGVATLGRRPSLQQSNHGPCSRCRDRPPHGNPADTALHSFSLDHPSGGRASTDEIASHQHLPNPLRTDPQRLGGLPDVQHVIYHESDVP